MSARHIPPARSAWRRLLATWFPPLLAVVAGTSPATSTQAVELTGTAFSVLYRGPAGTTAPADTAAADPANPGRRLRINPYAAPARTAPGDLGRPQDSLLRLVNGRNGQEVARAVLDTRLQGWLFTLPLRGLSGGPACLVLKNAAGQSLPVRDERPGDDGYVFRNPLWEAEYGRGAELAELLAERDKLVQRLRSDEDGLQKLQNEARASGLSDVGQCLPVAPGPEPARPASALTAEQARGQSAGACAWLWPAWLEKHVRGDWPRFFGDAGLAADWAARPGTQALAEALVAQQGMPGDQTELRLVVDAINKGATFLEHAEGVRAFARLQAQCRRDVQTGAQAAWQRWDAARQAAIDLPQRARRQCEAALARLDQVRQAQAKAPAYRQALDNRIATLERSPAAGTDSQRLDNQSCREP